MYPIPSNAKRIRYLECTGTQYVDTGFIPTAQTSFEMEFTLASPAYGYSPLAYSGDVYNSSDTFGASRQTSSQRCLGYRGSSFNFKFGDNITDLGSVLNLKFLRSGSSVVLTNKISGKTSTVSVSSSFTKGTRSLYVFNGNSSTADLTHPTSGKLYFFQLYDGSTLVRDLIPVRVGTVGYLFDRVGGTLFSNAGTGNFVLGPDLDYEGAVPCSMVKIGVHEQLPYDEQIEYIESTGDQYTTVRGIGPITRIEAEFRFTDVAIKQGRIVSTFNAGQSMSNDGVGEIYCNGNGVVASAWKQDWLASGYSATASAYVFDLNGVTKKTIWRRLSDNATTTKSHSSVGAFRSDLYVLHGHTSLSTNPNATSKAKLMWCKAYSYDNLVADLVPVRIGTVGALYDKVGGECFYNEGTGSFLLGV